MRKKHVLRRKPGKGMLGAKIVRRRKVGEGLSSLLSDAIVEGKKGKSFSDYLDSLGSKEILTHRRDDKKHPKNTGYVVLFAEDPEKNEHYGPDVWVLKTKLPDAEKCKDVIKFCAEYYDIDLGEAEDLINPDDIVDTARAWDDPAFVSDLWQAMEHGQVKERAGFRTYDGAVVIDPYSVKLDYYQDDDDDDDDDE